MRSVIETGFPLKGIALAAYALLTVSCGKLVFENRAECPAVLYLKAVNARDIPVDSPVYIEAFTPDHKVVLAQETADISSFVDGSAAVKVGVSQNVVVCGAAGADKDVVRAGTQWMALTGENWPALWRFSSNVPAFIDTSVENIRFKKEYMEVTVHLVNGWEEPDLPVHDYELTVTSSTAGIDLRTGLPVKGDFQYRPRMKNASFTFRVPRQKDRTLQFVIKPFDEYGRRYDDRAVRVVLWGALQNVHGFTWEVEDLPDLRVEYDCLNGSVGTFVDWIY